MEDVLASPFGKILKKIRNACVSRPFMAATAALAALFIILQQEVAGAVTFVIAVSLLLVVCDDIIAVLLPILSMSVMLLQCYNSFNTFIVFAPLAVIPAAALVFHLIAYRAKPRVGISVTGLIAVGAAVTLGGIGSIDPADYFKPIVLYYVGTLGFGMVLIYLFICSEKKVDRDYDVKEKLIDAMYITALLAAFQMAEIYVELTVFGAEELYNPDLILDGKLYPGGMPFGEVVANIFRDRPDSYFDIRIQPGNNVSTFVMITMPFVFYRAVTGKKIHLLTVLLCDLTLFISMSRGGLLLGGIETVVCFVFAAFAEKKKIWKIIFAAIPSLAVTAVAVFAAVSGAGKITAKFADDSRIRLIGRSFEAFRENPVFGDGLGNLRNSDIYPGVKGTLPWYHMMIPQVIGSMGIVGICAYLYQTGLRVFLTVKKYSTFVMTAALSYFGLFLMSQVNPGEFCPIPYGLIATVLFIFIEREPDRKRDKRNEQKTYSV